MKKYCLLIVTLLILNISYAQPKKTNTIKISGITFKEAANTLMDAGFTIEKTDSSFQTLRTDWKEGTGKNKWMKLRLHVRIKDSVAILTGDWYNTMFVGSNFLGRDHTIENSFEKIENTYGNPKACFKEMDAFAQSFKKPIVYSIVK